MDRLNEQEALFYEFRLEDWEPGANMLRRVNAILDLDSVREHMAAHYSPFGRPSIDPHLTVRMLLLGYLCGIKSERHLCEEVDLHIASDDLNKGYQGVWQDVAYSMQTALSCIS